MTDGVEMKASMIGVPVGKSERAVPEKAALHSAISIDQITYEGSARVALSVFQGTDKAGLCAILDKEQFDAIVQTLLRTDMAREIVHAAAQRQAKKATMQ